MADLVARINRDYKGFGVTISPEIVHVEPYDGVDKRCGWDTYIVTIHFPDTNPGVWGFTNGPLE